MLLIDISELTQQIQQWMLKVTTIDFIAQPQCDQLTIMFVIVLCSFMLLSS